MKKIFNDTLCIFVALEHDKTRIETTLAKYSEKDTELKLDKKFGFHTILEFSPRMKKLSNTTHKKDRKASFTSNDKSLL